MLDLKHLATLREVACHGSFAAAAEALSLAPSAVSQQMDALERSAKAVLFERSQRGNGLTEGGLRLLAHAESILVRVADAEAELAAIGGGAGGTLRLGSFTSATSTFTATAVERFRAQHPDVGVSFFDGEPYESAQRLRARQLDLAVVFDLDHWPTGRDYEGVTVCAEEELTHTPLFADPYRVVLRRDHHLAERTHLDLTDLEGELILGYAPWGRDLEEACARAGFAARFDRSSRATGFEAFQSFAAVGRGLTLMPKLTLGWLRDELVARPLHGAPARSVTAATPVGAYTSPATDAMLALLLGSVDALKA